MNSTGAALNPFSTRYHKPGSVDFLFEKAKGAGSARELYDTFQAHGRRGEIVGPHGTGKSTLLRALRREALARGVRVRAWRISERGIQRVDEDEAPGCEPSSSAGNPVLFLDGAERLPPGALTLLRAGCRLSGTGLLVTTHRPLGLPVLYRTSVDARLAREVVARVLAQSPGSPRWVTEHDAEEALRATGGDLREALFRLYDLYEHRWAAAGGRP